MDWFDRASHLWDKFEDRLLTSGMIIAIAGFIIVSLLHLIGVLH
jgi:hypothetical protein